MDDEAHDTLCPVCKYPMRKMPLFDNQWYCPQQKQAVEERRPVGPHKPGAALSVWTEARLDAWHSPA